MSYRENDLRKDIDQLNLKLANIKSPHQLKVNPRNGYCAVDVMQDGKCKYMLEAGSPNLCRTAANDFYTGELEDL